MYKETTKPNEIKKEALEYFYSNYTDECFIQVVGNPSICFSCVLNELLDENITFQDEIDTIVQYHLNLKTHVMRAYESLFGRVVCFTSDASTTYVGFEEEAEVIWDYSQSDFWLSTKIKRG